MLLFRLFFRPLCFFSSKNPHNNDKKKLGIKKIRLSSPSLLINECANPNLYDKNILYLSTFNVPYKAYILSGLRKGIFFVGFFLFWRVWGVWVSSARAARRKTNCYVPSAWAARRKNNRYVLSARAARRKTNRYVLSARTAPRIFSCIKSPLIT